MSPNPLHPYTWTARLRTGGRLRQFDHDGYHGSDELNGRHPREGAIFAHGRRAAFTPADVLALEIHGHPAGVLIVPARTAPGPEQVIIRTREDRAIARGGMLRGGSRWVQRMVGFRYAAGEFVGVVIDDAGRVWQRGRWS